MDQPYLTWMDRTEVDARVASIGQAELDYDDGEGRYLFRGQPFTGYSALRYPDGTLSSLTGFTDGIEHGVTVGWHPNGHISNYAETAESVFHGIVAEWDENGALIRTTRYRSGLEVKSNASS
jgi:antitoxin component YwqK of YwqJK toxin-antitoxin module